MIIYGTGELKQFSPQQPKAKCPQCGEYEITFHFFKQYFHLFWIPAFPIGSRKLAYCEKCHAGYQESIPESLKSDLERARMRTSFPWHIFSGTFIFILGICAIIYFSDGKTKHHYPSGKLQAEGKYVNDKPEGEWTFFHENGKVQSVQTFISGLEEGEWTWFNEQGIKTKSGAYHNGRYDGKWSFYSETGVLLEESMFKDNRKQGLTTNYYDDGKKAAEGNYERDREHGRWTYWHPNQTRMMEGEFNSGQRTGLWKVYFDDGSLNSETQYKDSVSYIESLYNREGKQLVKNGNGTFTDYYDNKQKQSEGAVKGGLYVRQWSYWYPDGKLREQGNFNEGHYTIQTSFDQDGKIMVLNGNGYHKTYHENGVVASECLYRNGKPHGLMLTRNDKGVTIGEVNYSDGKFEGESKYYYFSGELYSAGSFKNNLQVGVWIWYHLNGAKEAEVKFVNGQKEGEEIFYSENGEIVKREHYEKGVLVNEEAY